MTAAEDNHSQDQAADYDGEGREQAARDGGDSGVDDACGKDGSSGRQRRQTTTAMAADDGGG
jgi:hypothetical protein